MTSLSKNIISRQLLLTIVFGFSSGLPVKLIGETLQVWLKESDVQLEMIGILSLVALPYSLKFLWAPFFDQISLKFLGRRRGWILITQLLTFLAIILLGFIGITESLYVTAGVAFFVGFSSASQDIVLDAHRRDTLEDNELGLGSSLFVTGYRIALVLSGALSLYLSQSLSWSTVYYINACCLVPCMVATFYAPEPPLCPNSNFFKVIKESYLDLFQKSKEYGNFLYLLLFILLFKFGDVLAATLTVPFFLECQYTVEQIAFYGEAVGLLALLVGGVMAGAILVRCNLNRFLWVCAFLQAISTLAFVLLNHFPTNVWLFAFVEIFEKFTTGMGAIAFVTFLMRLTSKSYSATQYAFLTCLMTILPKLLGAFSGIYVRSSGWDAFFVFCTLAALPSILLLPMVAPWRQNKL